MTMSDMAKSTEGRGVKRGLFRRMEERVKFAERPKEPPLAAVRRPAHVARMLAMAHHIQWAIDDGRVADRAAVARGLGLTRARVTQPGIAATRIL